MYFIPSRENLGTNKYITQEKIIFTYFYEVILILEWYGFLS